MKNSISLLITLVLVCFSVTLTVAQSNPQFDVVLNGGRVIDPETKLDAIRNVGIRDGRIVEISANTLSGKQTVDVSGLVVSPGFIDLHVHGMTNVEQEYQAHDGVTSAFELEGGIPFLTEWYATRKNKALLNYGASVEWPMLRVKATGKYDKELELLKGAIAKGEPGDGKMWGIIGKYGYENLTAEQTSKLLSEIKASLNEGGIGIGIPVGYLPGATREEVFKIYKLAAELQVPIISHVREGGAIAVQQAISDAVVTNAPLHVVHMNSVTLAEIDLAIEMVNMAQKRGFDITTEVYPYTAASTSLESALFDEGWQEKFGITYDGLQWVATGERLTKETFTKYRKEGGTVIIHMMKPEWIKSGIASDNTMIASDGMPYAKLAHPRTAGTFSRVLGKYVREEKVISLPTAIEKMTLLPAKRLERVAPIMRFKGRIQVGSDADITVFDPNKIIDKATFEKGLAFSEGVQFVLVNGVFVLKDGKTVENVFPGQPVYGKYKR
ncbi:MAG: amidohydrolase family protein [Cyclobacteriaceae bacterium]